MRALLGGWQAWLTDNGATEPVTDTTTPAGATNAAPAPANATPNVNAPTNNAATEAKPVATPARAKKPAAKRKSTRRRRP